jgi:hypothetical protein
MVEGGVRIFATSSPMICSIPFGIELLLTTLCRPWAGKCCNVNLKINTHSWLGNELHPNRKRMNFILY